MRLRIILFVPVIALALALSLPGARALQADDPSALINNLVSEAIANITDRQEAEQDREMKFRVLLETGFDIPRISRFVLGRYWNAASEEQRQHFAGLFEEWVVRTYSARFKEYSGEVIRVIGTRAESETSTVVTSQFSGANGAPPAKVEWHVRKQADGGFKIIDVSVEGISMALTQRDEIASVADRNGGTAEGLNRALEASLAGRNTTAAK
jgi:phospholipid transport system substrate-binding protein